MLTVMYTTIRPEENRVFLIILFITSGIVHNNLTPFINSQIRVLCLLKLKNRVYSVFNQYKLGKLNYKL